MGMSDTATPIRDERLSRGWSQDELARRLTAEGAKVSGSEISRIERGLVMPYPTLRAALARIFNLDIHLRKANDEKVETRRDMRRLPQPAAPTDGELPALRGAERARPDQLPQLPQADVPPSEH